MQAALHVQTTIRLWKRVQRLHDRHTSLPDIRQTLLDRADPIAHRNQSNPRLRKHHFSNLVFYSFIRYQ